MCSYGGRVWQESSDVCWLGFSYKYRLSRKCKLRNKKKRCYVTTRRTHCGQN